MTTSTSVSTDVAVPTGDDISAARFALMADKIEADPALLEIPLANISRWLSQGHPAVERLEGWRRILENAKSSPIGMRSLLALLRDQSWDAVLWKGYSPFPGILNQSELSRLTWTSRH